MVTRSVARALGLGSSIFLRFPAVLAAESEKLAQPPGSPEPSSLLLTEASRSCWRYVCAQRPLQTQAGAASSRRDKISSVLATPWTAGRQASLSITNSWNLLKLMSIELVMPSNHLILCRPLLLLPSIFPSITVFSNESVLHIRWPKKQPEYRNR